MKLIKITLFVSLFFSFGLQAQKADNVKNNLNISLADLLANKSVGLTYERHLNQDKYLEVGLKLPFGQSNKLLDFFGENISQEMTQLSVGVKYFLIGQNNKRFNGLFIKPTIYAGLQRKSRPERSCAGWLCFAEYPELNKRDIVGGAMLHIGQQWQLNHKFSIEISAGAGYGIGHSVKTRFKPVSKSGLVGDMNVRFGYSF